MDKRIPEIRRLLRKAKLAYQKAQAVDDELTDRLNRYCVPEWRSMSTKAKHAIYLEDAVSNHVLYREYDEAALLGEIKRVFHEPESPGLEE